MKRQNLQGPSEYKKLLFLALPIMGGNILQTLYNIADSWFLGKVSKEALSSPTITFNIIFFLIVFGRGLSMAGTTLISQAKGKKDNEKINFYLGQTAFVLIVASVVLLIFGFITARPLLRLLQTPTAVFDQAYSYMVIIFWGIPFMFVSFLLSSSLQAVGDSITPLLIQIVTVSLNILLDWLFIFGIGPFPALGIKGAALATFFSRGVAAGIALFILIKGKKGLRLKLSWMRPKLEAIKLLLKIGLPSSIGNGISALGFSVLQGIINSFGISVIAAFGVGNRIFSVFNMPAQGFCQALTVLVGQRLGADRPDQAKRFVRQAFVTIFIMVGTAMAFTTFWGNHFVRFFIDDPEVIAVGVTFFKILSFSVLTFNLYTVITGAFQGGGDTKPIMYLSIFRLWGIRVPLCYLLSTTLKMGPPGIWIGMFTSNMVVTIIGLILYFSDRWIHKLNFSKI